MTDTQLNIIQCEPHKELEKKTPRFIIGAFSLVVALAWNEAIKDFIENHVISGKAEGLRYKLLYALIVTLVLFFVIIIVHIINNAYHCVKNIVINKFCE